MITRIEARWKQSVQNTFFGGVLIIYIGIDISKYKHDCFIATESGNTQFSFENNSDDFKLFLLELLKHKKAEMIIGFEATGHYGVNLKSLLMNHGYSFMEINAYLVKKFSDSHSLRKTKTDKKDAETIASYMKTVDYKTYHQQSYHIVMLKSYTRLRSKLVSIRTKHLNMTTKILDVIFPEYKTFWGNNGLTNTAIAILNRFTTPSKIAKMTDKHYEHFRRLSMGKFSYPKFTKLKNLAIESIGTDYPFYQTSLSIHLESIKSLTNQIDDLELLIIETMKQYPTHIETIKGVGIISAAIIISELGDISSFESPNQMLAYAGLDSTVNQSGTMESHGKLVKRGSKYLRSTLVNTSLSLLTWIPKFYAYYDKKKREGKHHRVALIHLARKFIRIIYHLETKHLNFDLTQVH